MGASKEDLIFFEELKGDVLQAENEGRITAKEKDKVIAAMIKGCFRGDEDPRHDLDPIMDRVYPEDAMPAEQSDVTEVQSLVA